MPYTNPFGIVYDSGDYPGAQDRVLALADWAGFETRRAEARRRGRCRGIGLANYIEIATGAPRERAQVTARPDGVVDVIIGTLSAGQGHETAFPQLIAEWLGVEPDRVRLIAGDTDRVAVGGGSHSGRSMRLGGVVMAKASDRLVARGARLAGVAARIGGGGRGVRASGASACAGPTARSISSRSRPPRSGTTRRPTCAGRSRASATRR